MFFSNGQPPAKSRADVRSSFSVTYTQLVQMRCTELGNIFSYPGALVRIRDCGVDQEWQLYRVSFVLKCLDAWIVIIACSSADRAEVTRWLAAVWILNHQFPLV